MNAEQILLAVLREEVCQTDTESSLSQPLCAEAIRDVYILAKKQDLAHLAGHVLSKRGVIGQDGFSDKLKKQAMQAVYRYVQMNHECERICKTLEEAKIAYMPLKGAVLRAYYPEPWMRTSCDIDILVKEENLDKAIAALQEQLQYTGSGKKGDHDVTLFSPSGVHLELHYDTIQERYAVNGCRDVLSLIWEDAAPSESGMYHHCMSDAMFYFYHIAHMAKHFEVGGCGIRPFLDLWILNHRLEHDKTKRDLLLRDGGLFKFAQTAEQVSEVWFSNVQPDALSQQVIDYILRAGLYGNNENRAALGQAKMGGRLRYVVLRRVFLPYDFLKADYPILKKHKWLTPLYQVIRWGRMLCSGRLKQTAKELKANMNTAVDTTASTGKMLKQLGL